MPTTPPRSAHCRQIRFVPGSLVGDEIRFHCDQNVPNRLVDMLRARGVSVSTTSGARLADRSDVEQLRYAARHRRVLITNDVKWDFVALAESMPHAGVLFCNGGGRFPRDVLRRCLELRVSLGGAVPAGELSKNSLAPPTGTG